MPAGHWLRCTCMLTDSQPCAAGRRVPLQSTTLATDGMRPRRCWASGASRCRTGRVQPFPCSSELREESARGCKAHWCCGHVRCAPLNGSLHGFLAGSRVAMVILRNSAPLPVRHALVVPLISSLSEPAGGGSLCQQLLAVLLSSLWQAAVCWGAMWLVLRPVRAVFGPALGLFHSSSESESQPLLPALQEACRQCTACSQHAGLTVVLHSFVMVPDF